MAIPTKLGVAFAPQEIGDMKSALETVTNTIKAKLDMNLSNDERSSLNTVGNERIPFIQRSIKEHAVNHANLNGLAYSVADATNDLSTYEELTGLMLVMNEAKERLEEMQMVAGHYCYRFMRDQYMNADRYRADNVDGAQVVYDDLKTLFEDQGTQNPL